MTEASVSEVKAIGEELVVRWAEVLDRLARDSEIEPESE